MAFSSAIHSTKKYRLGTQLKDANGGVWVYGQGVASTVAGDFVVFDKSWQSSRLTTSSAGGPVGVAGAALVALDGRMAKPGGGNPLLALISMTSPQMAKRGVALSTTPRG